MRLFAEPKSESERAKAVIFWEQLLSPTAKSFGWRWPWFTKQRDDGANVFSAWNPETARGFTLDEVGTDLTTFDAFCQTFDEGGAGIAYLRIRTDGSVANISTICRLFDLWVGTDVRPEDITSIVAALKRGDRGPLIKGRADGSAR